MPTPKLTPELNRTVAKLWDLVMPPQDEYQRAVCYYLNTGVWPEIPNPARPGRLRRWLSLRLCRLAGWLDPWNDWLYP